MYGGLVIIDCKGHEARTEYVALACQLVPLLLDEIERLEAERKRMRAALDLFADEANWCDEQWAHPLIGVVLARRGLREEAS